MKTLLHWAPVASGFLVLVLSMFVAVLTVSRRSSTSDVASTQNLSTKAAEQLASLSLSPAAGDYIYTPGASYPLGIVLDSAGKSVDGADVIIKFNPQMAQVVSAKVAATSLFEQFPQNAIDNALGQVKFSALTFNPRPVTGIIGTFTFKPLSKGTINFTFDFTAGATKNSSIIVEHGTVKNLLGQAAGGSYTFR